MIHLMICKYIFLICCAASIDGYAYVLCNLAGSVENLNQPLLTRAPSLPRSFRQRSGIPVISRDNSLRNGCKLSKFVYIFFDIFSILIGDQCSYNVETQLFACHLSPILYPQFPETCLFYIFLVPSSIWFHLASGASICKLSENVQTCNTV